MDNYAKVNKLHEGAYWRTAAPKAASTLSTARYPLRFWGTLDSTTELLACIRDLSNLGNPNNKSTMTEIDIQLRIIQAIALFLFHPCDHALWLDNLAPGFFKPNTNQRYYIEKLGIWSSTIATLIMLVRSYRAHNQNMKEISSLRRQITSIRTSITLTALSPKANPLTPMDPVSSSAASSSSAQLRSLLSPDFTTTTTSLSDSALSTTIPSTPNTTNSAATALAESNARINELELSLLTIEDNDSRTLIRASKELTDLITCIHFAITGGIGISDNMINWLGLYSAVIGGYLKWIGMPPLSKY